MPTVTFRIRPVHSWTPSDEISITQVLNENEYKPCASPEPESDIRHFESQKTLEHNLWVESEKIANSLIARLYCLFKFELRNEQAKVTRWNEVTGQPWFDKSDERF
jgi:hypothetical protein